MYHADLRDIFNKFGRDWFRTYSFYNLYDDMPRDTEVSQKPKQMLAYLVKRGYIIRKNGKKINYNQKWVGYLSEVKATELWRLSGKTIHELNQVLEDFNEEMTDQDHVDIVKIKLIE